jgi:UDP-N-acetyl-alpha-D-muramoyl-L-alanyl-L-glutamate epimerase
MTLTSLRQQYPRFSYDSFQSEITPEGLKITHHFKIEPDIEFHPTVTLEGVTAKQWTTIPQELRDQWIFHLGLAEIPSYWKATASPEIVIKAGYLNSDQISCWKNLLMKGMGEYFYINQIDFTEENFVSWSVDFPETALTPDLNYPPISSKYLVPIGGGKDSTLTLCLLDKNKLNYDVFLLNPTPAMEQIAQIAHPQRTIIAKRIIDPRLLELNEKGYLNGHTPFSAYLGFLSRFTGFIFGNESVVISNERSSNEGNVLFHDQTINHQYSKTYEFEQGFNKYLKKNNLVPSQQTAPSYFSLLRPLYELQISQLFLECSDFDQYAPIFRSCNRGQKTNTWCGECSKCLFAYITFYPFLDTEKTIEIFGQDLFTKKYLLDEALALLGKTETKPFDCVGTHEESMAAFYLCIEKSQAHHPNLPILLQLVWDQVLSKQHSLKERSEKILHSWDQNHQLPGKMEVLIQDEIKNLKKTN